MQNVSLLCMQVYQSTCPHLCENDVCKPHVSLLCMQVYHSTCPRLCGMHVGSFMHACQSALYFTPFTRMHALSHDLHACTRFHMIYTHARTFTRFTRMHALSHDLHACTHFQGVGPFCSVRLDSGLRACYQQRHHRCVCFFFASVCVCMYMCV